MKAEVHCADVANLGLLNAEVCSLEEIAAYTRRVDAQLAEVDLHQSDVLMGHAGEGCIEQRAERGNGEDEWQSHAEKSADTHSVFCVPFLFFGVLFLLFIGGVSCWAERVALI